MDVFDAFSTQEVELILRKQHAGGDQEGTVYCEDAVVKQRQGMAQSAEKDTRTGDATIYLRPSSKFVTATDGNMVGNYARIETGNVPEQLYRIASWSEGKDQDTGEVLHYRLDLERKDATTWAQNSILE